VGDSRLPDVHTLVKVRFKAVCTRWKVARCTLVAFETENKGDHNASEILAEGCLAIAMVRLIPATDDCWQNG
jgi:N-acetylglucosamine kinase-like BadF-type ATPase